MRKLILTSAVLLGGAIAIVGCHPVEGHFSHNHNAGWQMGHRDWEHHDDVAVNVPGSLNCPDHEGELTRTAQAADGKSCQYHGDDDQDVTLSLVALNGQAPQATFAPMEADLRSLVPARAGNSMVNVDAGSGHGDDHAKIDLPGLHINADGKKADIRIFGADIKADGDNAVIKTDMGVKGTTIHAGPGGAEIRANNVGQHADELVFILAGDNPGPSGYRAVGYIARGPSSGPLVVGEFKAIGHDHNGHDHDLESLIDLNVTPAT